MAVTGASPRSRGDAQRLRARAEWVALRNQLATVTPRAAARAGLVAVVLAAVAYLAAATWPALLPFVGGGILAFGVLPVVDSLDRVMPRALAAVLAVAGVLLAVGLVIAIVVPALAQALLQFAAQIPGREQIDS